jgi:hypothetical protein
VRCTNEWPKFGAAPLPSRSRQSLVLMPCARWSPRPQPSCIPASTQHLPPTSLCSNTFFTLRRRLAAVRIRSAALGSVLTASTHSLPHVPGTNRLSCCCQDTALTRRSTPVVRVNPVGPPHVCILHIRSHRGQQRSKDDRRSREASHGTLFPLSPPRLSRPWLPCPPHYKVDDEEAPGPKQKRLPISAFKKLCNICFIPKTLTLKPSPPPLISTHKQRRRPRR